MFMEYCDTGTIEEAAKMGLPEYLIRRYTREIVQAVNHLHENSIVHRDIKGYLRLVSEALKKRQWEFISAVVK